MENHSPLPKINFVGIRKLLVVFLLLVFSFGLGYLGGFKGYKIQFEKYSKVNITREPPVDKSNVDFSLFWKVWDTLDSGYFDKEKINEREMIYGAISGMVSALGDPYTVFLSPAENRVVQEDLQGSFEGVGIQIGFKGNQLAVITPLPSSPAEEAGIKAGDFIVGIKDEAKKIDRGTVGITLPEAIQAIRGQAGTKVTLILLREGEPEPLVVDIVRAKVDVPSVMLSFVGEGESVAHLRLLKFGGDTNGEWGNAIKEILKKPQLKGIVLDVRNNPGGYLQGAVDVSSEFLKVSSVVVVEEHASGTKKEGKVTKIGRIPSMKVVVLVNGGSASAAEIVAGALKDNKRATIVGEKTFGKGTIQEPQELNGGSGLHLTIARWLTPSGVWVNDVGLEPDVLIEDDESTPEDEQLKKAIEIIEG